MNFLNKLLLLIMIEFFFIINLHSKIFYNPVISPDGEKICFVYENNIWCKEINSGKIFPVTLHPANDFAPVWSEDSKKIAFASDRTGIDEIYIVELPNGSPVQITNSGIDLVPTDWRNDKILLNSYINYKQGFIFVKNTKDLSSREIENTFDNGANGKISPDGKNIIYTRGNFDFWRRNYIGSGNSQIWIKKFDNKFGEKKLTDYNGDDFNPIWSEDGTGIYFISDRDGRRNIYFQKIDSKNAKQLTFYKDKDVLFFSLSEKKKLISFQLDNEIWLFDLNTKKTKKVDINIKGDFSYNEKIIIPVGDKISEIEFFPDNSYVIVSFGELFYSKNTKSNNNENKNEKFEIIKNVTNNIALDKNCYLSPDSVSISFESQKNDYNNIYIYNIKSNETIQVTDTEEDVILYNWDLKGDYFIYEINNVFYKYDKKEKNSKKIFEDPTLYFISNIDKKWWVCGKSERFNGEELFLFNIDENKIYPITSSYFYKSYVGINNKNELIYIFKGDLYKLALEKEENKEDLEYNEDNLKNKKVDAKADSIAKKEINIDFNFITARSKLLLSKNDDIRYALITSDKENIIYAVYSKSNDNYELRKYNFKKEKDEKLGTIDNIEILRLSPKNDDIYIISRGKLYKMSGSQKEKINFKDELIFNRDELYKTIFREAWLSLKYNFYDPDMHGVNWKEMYKKYLPMIEDCRTNNDFSMIVKAMIGELKASHCDYRMSSDFYTKRYFRTSFLGLIFDYSYSGPGYKIDEILINGPFDKKNIDIKKGDYIVAIDDEIITKDKTIYSYLLRKKDTEVKIKYNSKPDTIGAKTVTIKPISFWDEMDLYYNTMVFKNKKLVEEKTKNRVAYFHIRSMDNESLERFEKEYYSESFGKDGIIIDVRNNGGGNIHEELYDILNKKIFAISKDRFYGKESLQPANAFTGKIVLLINEYSYSDAEIFPHIFKFCKFGKILGVPTNGSVIGTREKKLMDGSIIRLPFTGWYTLDKENLENNQGIKPDIYVENTPEDVANNFDRQLEEAINYILK